MAVRARLTRGREITLRELAVLLGEPSGRAAVCRLRRRLRGVERDRGVTVLWGIRPLRTTEAALRRHVPEWFDQQTELSRIVLAELAGIWERIREVEARQRALGARLRAHCGTLRHT